jgi:glycosyltransferase involved in cell wall biosynthesis
MPTISVIMPAYNAAGYIAQAIESILKQTFSDFEFIIIDDGSQDETLAVVERYSGIDRRILPIHWVHIGIARSLNMMLEGASGTFIARMDADDIAMPERLARQLEYLKDHPECAVVGTRVLCVDPDNVPICELFNVTEHDRIDCRHMEFRGSAIAHPSVLMRRGVIEDLGGYRVDTEPAEDIDLWLRIAERAHLANLPNVLMHYRLHEGNMGHRRSREQIDKMFAAVKEAHARRGMRLPEDIEARRTKETCQAVLGERYNWLPTARYVHIACRAGCYSNARRLAWNGLKKRPWSVDSWLSMLLSLAGRHASGLIEGWMT